jgi:hypothetical protein
MASIAVAAITVATNTAARALRATTVSAFCQIHPQHATKSTFYSSLAGCLSIRGGPSAKAPATLRAINANWKLAVPRREQSAFAAYVGNWTDRRRLIRRSTEPDLNRHPEKSTVIDRPWETGRNDRQDQTIKNNLGDFACPHETKSCARAIDFNRQRQFVTMRAC